MKSSPHPADCQATTTLVAASDDTPTERSAPVHDPAPRSARDLLLINPSEGGSGDLALGDKLAQLALSRGGRVTLVRPDLNGIVVRHLAPSGAAPHALKDLDDPLIVSAPSSMISPPELLRVLASLDRSRAPLRGDLALIDEMDIAQQSRIDRARRKVLEAAGFRSLSMHRLGFSEGAIGYLPLSGAQVAAIKRQAPAAVANFIDSLNVDAPVDAPLYFAYISTSMHGRAKTAAHFVHHTLKELPAGAKAASYVVVTGDASESCMQDLIKDLGPSLRATEDIGEKPARRFGRARILTLDLGERDPGLREVGQVTGLGRGRRERPNLTIVLTRALPAPLFAAALSQAKEVMATGDHSLSEALSIRGTLPYYALPEWKTSLRDAVVTRARRVGGEALAQAVATRFSTPPSRALPSPTPEARTALDRELLAHTADARLQQLFTRERTPDTAPAPSDDEKRR
jgi:hypothetical protein